MERLCTTFSAHNYQSVQSINRTTMCPSDVEARQCEPLPKESPLTECNQLRPISLTNIIMRLFERVVYKQEIASAFKSVIGRDQFAYKEGTNTTDALIMCLHHWLKWLDEGADSVRVISFDYKKAFDSVSHNIICEKLKTLEINPYTINWDY